MYCRNCGTQLQGNVSACTSCGVPPKSGKKHCHSCGKPTVAEAVVCVNCGVSLRPVNDKSRTTAGILALLLGGLGVHKFYLGNNSLGLVYLLFSWTFVPAIVGAVEGLIYLTMSDDAFAEKYLA